MGFLFYFKIWVLSGYFSWKREVFGASKVISPLLPGRDNVSRRVYVCYTAQYSALQYSKVQHLTYRVSTLHYSAAVVRLFIIGYLLISVSSISRFQFDKQINRNNNLQKIIIKKRKKMIRKDK